MDGWWLAGIIVVIIASRPSSQIQKRCTHVSFGFIVCGRKMDLCLAIDHGILTLQLLEWNRVLRLTFWQLLNLTVSTGHFTSLHFTIIVHRVNFNNFVWNEFCTAKPQKLSAKVFSKSQNLNLVASLVRTHKVPNLPGLSDLLLKDNQFHCKLVIHV